MTNRREFVHTAAWGMGWALFAKHAGSARVESTAPGSAALTSPEAIRQLEDRFPYFQSTPVSYRHVKMQDGFWAPRQKIAHNVSVPWATRHLDAAGGLDALTKDPANYTAETRPGDIEAIKFIEAMASVVGLHRDVAVERLVDAWGTKLIAGQAPDGYSAFGYPLGADPAKRWQAWWLSHEDYALGHYLESAIAYWEATGNEAMYRSAVRAVDNMASVFLGGQRAYAPGHAEIEQALMRLYSVTGNATYLQLCGWLIGQRGQHAGRKSFGKYGQDHLPVQAQRTIEGHAVRAGFLFNGVTEYVGATGDAAYREAVLAVWEDLVTNKLYLHGASGNESAKNVEGYSTKANFLPPDDVFGESCAVFANFQWAHSLFRLTGEARYLDTAERMLYNAFYASLALAGDRYFYHNVAQVLFQEPRLRFAWHPVPCCPPNIVKLFCKVGGFFYATDRQGIFVKHYGASEAEIPFARGVKLVQRTDFPWSGNITLQVEPKRPVRFALRLRVPAWAKSHTVLVNGTTINTPLQRGWLVIQREWKRGDTVELSLPMHIERITMPPRFQEYADLVALQRGPIVYCLEEQDVTAARADSFYLYLPKDARFTAEHRPDLLGGVTVLRGNLQQYDVMDGSDTPVPAMFIPYGVWNNRTPGAMRIWLRSRKTSLDDWSSFDPPGTDSEGC